MAATVEARRLTEAHRLAQARLGARTVRQLLLIWPLLDLENLDRTVERWLAAAIPVISSQRSTSARLAANYMATFRTLELGVDAGSFAPVLAESVPAEQVATSLVVTGPARVRAGLSRGRPLASVAATAQATSAASGMRHVLNGGRETIVGTTGTDRQALGWARATSGRACSFCALLSSRGPVYSDDTVHFDAHDHCSCTAEPIYRPDAAWPAGAREYARIYREAVGTLSGADARNAFRRALAR